MDSKFEGLLSQNPIFSELEEGELKEISAITKYAEYEENELVFSQSQIAHYIFLVADGSFQLSLPNSEHKIFLPGEIFGEIAIINKNLRSGSVWAQEASGAYAICGTRLFQKEHVRPSTALKIVRALSIKITNYLRSREQIATEELIREGESEFVEFKSSLRFNKYTRKKDRAIEMASLKTIAAFLNAEGGTLLVGVSDDHKILGLKDDQFQNEDKLLLHLNKLIKDRIGTLLIPFIDASVEELSGKFVLRIDCQASTIPAYVKNGSSELFFIRTGPSTTNLQVSKIYDYIRMRFYKGAND